MSDFIAWLLSYAPNDFCIDLARVQFEEQRQRREALDRELCGDDYAACRERVIARMRDGDKYWIPPMYNREKHHKRWLKKQRKNGNVVALEGRR